MHLSSTCREQARHSPVPAGAVARRVLLHDRRDLEQTELVQHHELSGRHADHLQSLAVQARAVRLDEAVPPNAMTSSVAETAVTCDNTKSSSSSSDGAHVSIEQLH